MLKPDLLDPVVANFVQKAFDIISVKLNLTQNQESEEVVEWSVNGKEFIIKDIEKFQEEILPKHFRHRNMNSFVRQLNMYGFHKSRKEPTKHIFSHPFFQKNKEQLFIYARELLSQVRRKIKNQEEETPQKIKIPEISQAKIGIQIKRTAEKEEPSVSLCSIGALKSGGHLSKENYSPMKSFLISKSFILDINPQACLVLRDKNCFVGQEEEQEQDDNISIDDQIKKERERFNNRTQGISIVKTLNFLQEFQF